MKQNFGRQVEQASEPAEINVIPDRPATATALRSSPPKKAVKGKKK